MLCGISPPFDGLFHTRRQVTHVLLTRSPRARSLYCYRKLRVRLACVRHAASVRSEPGSNSRLKLVFPATCSDLHPSLSRGNALVAQLRSKLNGFWHVSSAIFAIVKERKPSCPAGWLRAIRNYTTLRGAVKQSRDSVRGPESGTVPRGPATHPTIGCPSPALRCKRPATCARAPCQGRANTPRLSASALGLLRSLTTQRRPLRACKAQGTGEPGFARGVLWYSAAAWTLASPQCWTDSFTLREPCAWPSNIQANFPFFLRSF
jgi:hypothetical protein